MRRYVVYLIEKDVAKNYIGKEKMLYQLFCEAENKISPYHAVVKKQINYITRDIPSKKLHNTFLSELKHVLTSYEPKKNYEIQLEENVGRAVLIVNPQYLSIYAYGSMEAETIFFEVLRKIETCFLAIDFKNDNFGWLYPKKRKEFV